ncbi:MAG TPA: hypothetical protein VGN23_15825 [Verrucomicrobiae bacterium]|jgi:hypothetical protein
MSATEIIEQIKVLPANEQAEVAKFIVGQDDSYKPFDVTPELESWLLEAADKPTSPLTKTDFAAIRQRARKSSAA